MDKLSEEEKKAIGEIDISKTIESNINYWRNEYFEQQKELEQEKNKNRKLDRENQALYESINCDDNTMLARLYQEEKEKNKWKENEQKELLKYKSIKIEKLEKEFEAEKEKNKKLEEELITESDIGYQCAKTDYDIFYIHKDKIKKELTELDNMKVDGEVFKTAVNFAKKILQELLEEE